MGWRRTHRETDLERELRAQRPRPRAELVELLCRASAAGVPRRSLLPRIALVAAVVVVVAASLGATGAVGYATKSVHALGTSVLHVVQSPAVHSGKKGNGNGGGGDGDKQGHYPFHHEYGHRVPICHDGKVVYVPSDEYLYRLLHGDKPAPCPPHRRR